ncbi:MAG: hypothetical protein QOI83_3327 [Streptomycetaceae bacterium]|nr:hypothetical protein [Streptomycetaceae bacterium]
MRCPIHPEIRPLSDGPSGNLPENEVLLNFKKARWRRRRPAVRGGVRHGHRCVTWAKQASLISVERQERTCVPQSAGPCRRGWPCAQVRGVRLAIPPRALTAVWFYGAWCDVSDSEAVQESRGDLRLPVRRQKMLSDTKSALPPCAGSRRGAVQLVTSVRGPGALTNTHTSSAVSAHGLDRRCGVVAGKVRVSPGFSSNR